MSFYVESLRAEKPPKIVTVGNMTVRKRYRDWEVIDEAGVLVCITVYKCGALEVARRLQNRPAIELRISKERPARRRRQAPPPES